MLEKLQKTADYRKSRIGNIPEVAIILGSGLGGLVNEIQNPTIIPYHEIPNFPVSTVEGHKGNLIAGTLSRKPVIAMQGRFHFYEGYSMEQLTFPIKVFKTLGISHLFVSNASGGLNPTFKPGDLMIIKDHINLFGTNPLIGKNDSRLGPRFPDMKNAYRKDLIKIALEIAKKHSIRVQQGVYVGLTGPSYETPAEIAFLQRIGCDAVGMSTVPEIIVGNHLGMKCFAISVVTNSCTEEVATNADTSHEDVQNVATVAEPAMTKIFIEMIKTL